MRTSPAPRSPALWQSAVTRKHEQQCRRLADDAVFAVKEPLIAQFRKQPPGKAPTGEQIDASYYVMNFDFVLQPI